MKQALTVILAATILWTITGASAQPGQHNKQPKPADEQRAAVDQHRDAVDALREQIDQTLAAESGDFSALLGNAEPSFQERRDLARLRKELLEQSDAAQATVGEIEELDRQFRESNDPPLPGIHHLDSVVRPERIDAHSDTFHAGFHEGGDAFIGETRPVRANHHRGASRRSSQRERLEVVPQKGLPTRKD